MLPSDGCTTVISHPPWQHFPPLATFQLLQSSVPKLQTFSSTFKSDLVFKISLFSTEFSEISQIWLKVSTASESQGKSSFNVGGNLFRASTVTKTAALQKAQTNCIYLLFPSPYLSDGQSCSLIKRLQSRLTSMDVQQVTKTLTHVKFHSSPSS